jgi:hypothetical protein
MYHPCVPLGWLQAIAEQYLYEIPAVFATLAERESAKLKFVAIRIRSLRPTKIAYLTAFFER